MISNEVKHHTQRGHYLGPTHAEGPKSLSNTKGGVRVRIFLPGGNACTPVLQGTGGGMSAAPRDRGGGSENGNEVEKKLQGNYFGIPVFRLLLKLEERGGIDVLSRKREVMVSEEKKECNTDECKSAYRSEQCEARPEKS